MERRDERGEKGRVGVEKKGTGEGGKEEWGEV